MSESMPTKRELVGMVKRKLERYMYQKGAFRDLPNCKESYKCLNRLNTTILIKVNTCLTSLVGK